MDKMVVQYLPKAFAFVYVINSANAGGIQKDRVSILSFSVDFTHTFFIEGWWGGAGIGTHASIRVFKILYITSTWN